MLEIVFNENYNGKLFNDCFGSVELKDPERFFLGNQLKCILKGGSMGTLQMGVVEVVAVYDFSLATMNDALSFIDVGQNGVSMTAMLIEQARKEGVILNKISKEFDRVVFQYVSRNIETQRTLVINWWKAIDPNQKFE